MSNNDLSSFVNSSIPSNVNSSTMNQGQTDINSSLRKMNQVKGLDNITANELNELISAIDGL